MGRAACLYAGVCGIVRELRRETRKQRDSKLWKLFYFYFVLLFGKLIGGNVHFLSQLQEKRGFRPKNNGIIGVE